MSEFTEGRWKVVKNGLQESILIFAENKKYHIAGCMENFYDERRPQLREREANARLISTAPLGYELAEKILKYNKEISPTFKGKDSGLRFEKIVALARQIKAQADGKE